MKFPRRQFLRILAGTAALPALSRKAWSQTYPVKPVRLVVGFAAGATTDIVARLMGQWLSERLGQQFVVENRTGASGNIAVEAVMRASGDGYFLLVTDPSPAINAALYDKLNYNFIGDFAPVASLIRAPFVMEINPSFPATTVREFIAYAKANPGRVNMASAGIGNVTHIFGEMFKMMAGLNMVHVPYRGGAPAVTDLIGGQVQVYFGALPGSIEYIKAGKLRALAVTTAKRWEALPDIATVGESVPGYEATYWLGIMAPKSTPAAIVDKLNEEINVALADPGMTARLADLGAAPMPMTPADFSKHIAAETEKWGKVVRALNIRVE
jgi:tripartite-type tricarboxylate transporter receptor subunit TctC